MRAYVFGLIAQFASMSAISSCPEGTVAQEYLRAIQSMNWSQMESMLAKGATYTDPTMTYFDRDAIELEGSDNIVEFWRRSSEESGTSDISYTTTQCFETAGYYVFNLDIDVRVAGEFWNVDKEWINLPGKLLTIVRVKDGKVTEHHDYVEYSSATREVSDLQNKYGALRN